MTCDSCLVGLRTRYLYFISLQCVELLDSLGVPHLKSEGEAEALCALLNSQGVTIADYNTQHYFVYICVCVGVCVWVYGGHQA